MAFDEKEGHAREFTDIERTTLRVWFDLDQAGNDPLADQVLDAGLQLEHYTSLLSDDFSLRTAAQLAKQAQLRDALTNALDLARAFFQQRATVPTGGLTAIERWSGVQRIK